jgi:hypothetical protein
MLGAAASCRLDQSLQTSLSSHIGPRRPSGDRILFISVRSPSVSSPAHFLALAAVVCHWQYTPRPRADYKRSLGKEQIGDGERTRRQCRTNDIKGRGAGKPTIHSQSFTPTNITTSSFCNSAHSKATLQQRCIQVLLCAGHLTRHIDSPRASPMSDA